METKIVELQTILHESYLYLRAPKLRKTLVRQIVVRREFCVSFKR